MNKRIHLISTLALLLALVMSALWAAPGNAVAGLPDGTADVVWGQGGSFTTNTVNKGGVSANSLWWPYGVIVDGSDNLYVGDYINNRILYYPAGSTTATRVYGQGGSFTSNANNNGGVSANSLDDPNMMALDGDGNLYVADGMNSRVLYYPAGSTTATRVYGQGGSFTTNSQNKGGISADSLSNLYGIALDSTGNLYIADTNNHRVLYYPAGSTTATLVYGQGGSFTTNNVNKGGISADSLYYPHGIAVDSGDNLYVTDHWNHRVLYYPAGSTTATRVYGQGGDFTTATANKGGLSADSLYYPMGAAVDGSGNLFVADYSNNRVLYYPAGSTTATAVYGQGGDFTTGTANKGGLSADSLYGPRGIALDGSGNLYFADIQNNRVLEYVAPPPTPGAFGKSDPANGASNVSTAPTLMWGVSSAAAGYEYCIDTSNDDACATGWVSTGTDTQKALSGLSYSTTYYWQVRASNVTGTTYADGGAWWSFTTGNVPAAFGKNSPFNGGSNKPLSLTLYWNTSSAATNYEYCYDTSNDGSCAGSWVSTGTTRNATISGLSLATSYYWQVRAVNSFGTTYADGGSWWSFTTGNVPAAFNKAAPADLVVNQPASLTLSWNASSGASSYEYCYDTSNDGSCAGSWVSTGTARSALISGLSAATTYYWQVRAVNSFGPTYANGGIWWSFSTRNMPAAFGKNSPFNGVVNRPLSLTLYWNASSDATGYEYCFDTTNNGTCDGSWVSTGAARNALLSGLLNGTTYYWQVRAVNSFGNTYANSGTWWSFITIP